MGATIMTKKASFHPLMYNFISFKFFAANSYQLDGEFW